MSLHNNHPHREISMNQPATASKHHHEKPNHTKQVVSGQWQGPTGQWSVFQPSRPSDIMENGTARLLGIRLESGPNSAVLLRPAGDGWKDGHRQRCLIANNQKYTKIISITILTVEQDLYASVPSILSRTPVSSKIMPTAPRMSYIPKPV
jgi:hypothetical protein